MRKRTKGARRRHTWMDVLLGDTITGIMMRTLCEKGTMTQREFMRAYHEACARPCRYCNATGVLDVSDAHMRPMPRTTCPECKGTKIDPSRSGFNNNFGRYIRASYSAHRGAWYRIDDDPIRCMSVGPAAPNTRSATVTWDRSNAHETLLVLVDDRTLEAAEQRFERIATSSRVERPSTGYTMRTSGGAKRRVAERQPAEIEQALRWLAAIREAIATRANDSLSERGAVRRQESA